MNEEQMKEFKRLIKLRIEYCEQDRISYEQKGSHMKSYSEELKREIGAYQTVLNDLERILNGE